MTTTVDEQRCSITELRVGECAHCRKLPDPEPLVDDEFELPDRSPGPLFEAMYRGRCAGCESRFEVGDLIRRRDSGDYECEDCSRR